jgi:hypothetical protein
MNILPKSAPSSVRSGSSTPKPTFGARGPEPRPYLVSIQPRRAGAPPQPPLQLFPHESEDARLTGTTRSLYRRLLALNLPCHSQTQGTQQLNASTVLTVSKFKTAKEGSPTNPRPA